MNNYKYIAELIQTAVEHQESLLARFPQIEGSTLEEARLGVDHVQLVLNHPDRYPYVNEIPINDYLEWTREVT